MSSFYDNPYLFVELKENNVQIFEIDNKHLIVARKYLTLK